MFASNPACAAGTRIPLTGSKRKPAAAAAPAAPRTCPHNASSFESSSLPRATMRVASSRVNLESGKTIAPDDRRALPLTRVDWTAWCAQATPLSGARQELDIALGIHIATRQHRDPLAVRELVGMEQQAGQRYGSGRLEDELQLARGHRHRVDDLGFADEDNAVEVAAQIFERDLRRGLAAEAVGDGPGDLVARPRRALASGERVARVRGDLRLDAKYVRVWSQRLHRKRHACRETTKADRDENDRRLFSAELGELVEDLEANRAGARDDSTVVGRRHELQSVFIGNLVRTRHALLVVRPDEDDLAAVAAHASDLDLGRVLGHDHYHAHPEDAR